MNHNPTRRHALACALLAGLAATTWPLAAHAGAIEDMAAFDAVYIPALSASSAATQSAAQGPQALAAIERLRARWPSLRTPLSSALRGQEAALGRVDRHITQAASLAARGVWKDCHEALEHVRIELMGARKALGIDYFVDHLTAFHEPMEEIVLMAASTPASQFDATRRARMEQAFTRASVLWRQVEAHVPLAAPYGLSEARMNQLREGMAGEARALSALSAALRDGDAATVLKAAGAIKPPFARAFTAFGQNP